MGVAVADASTFFFAATMVALIKVDARPKKEEQEEVHVQGIWARFWTEWLNGLKVVKRSRPLSILFGFTAITQIGEGVLSVMMAVFVAQIFGGGPEELGLLFGCQAIGGMVGSLFVGNVAKKIDPTRLLGLCAVVFGIISLAIINYPAFYPSIIPAYVLIALIGIPVVGLITSLFTLLQTGAEDEYRGRVFGAWGTTATIASLAGMVIATALGDTLGPVILLNLQGLGYMLAGLMVLVLLAGLRARVAGMVKPETQV
jgi:MFS family permease